MFTQDRYLHRSGAEREQENAFSVIGGLFIFNTIVLFYVPQWLKKLAMVTVWGVLFNRLAPPSQKL